MIADMSPLEAAVGIAIAVITAGGAIGAAIVAQLTRRDNASQHGTTADKLDEVIAGQAEHGRRLDRVEGKVDGVAERVAVVEAHVGDRVVGGPGRRLEVVVEPIPPH